MKWQPCVPTRRGHTLIELIIAMTSASVLTVGLGASVLVASRAFRPETTAQHARTTASLAQHDLLADLRLATGFTERTDKTAAFLVPDRDGDGKPETLRYAWSGKSGDPLTLSYNGAAAFPVLNDVRALSLAYLTRDVAGVTLPAEQTGSQILLLVNDSKNPTGDELARKATIESWNFVVKLAGLNDAADVVLKEAQQAKAIYVSGTVNAANLSLTPTLAAMPIGIVNEHPDLAKGFGFSSASGSVLFATQVNIVENSHYITSGLSGGNVSVANVSSAMYTLTGTLATDLHSLATVSGAPALATVDPGKLLYDGRTAAGRRVMLPWGGAQRDPLSWNATGQLLTCRAIEWATGLGQVSPELKTFGYATVFASSNSSANYQLSTRASLPEKGRVRSISAYVGGASAQVRFAIYSDKVGQPDQLLVQSSIGNTTSSMAWVTLTVPPTDLAPGNYWLAFSFADSSQKYHYISSYSGAGERNKSNAAVPNGFLGSWGTSNSSYSGARSIYATYEVLP